MDTTQAQLLNPQVSYLFESKPIQVIRQEMQQKRLPL